MRYRTLTTRIIVHHSAGHDGPDNDWDGIRQYHKDKGWADIGYHAGVENVGGIPRLMEGRRVDAMGAHCIADHANTDSLGFCFVGNFTKEKPSQAHTLVAMDQIAKWCIRYGVDPGEIYGHKEVPGAATECPGKVDVLRLREMVRLHIPQLVALTGQEDAGQEEG